MIRVLSVILVTLLVAGVARFYGVIGALVALPVAILISFATEKLIARMKTPLA